MSDPEKKDDIEGTRDDNRMNIVGDDAPRETVIPDQAEVEARNAVGTGQGSVCERYGHLPRLKRNGTPFEPRECRSCGSAY